MIIGPVTTGGESAALARVDDYVVSSGALKEYKDTRNSSLGTHYSSQLSMYL